MVDPNFTIKPDIEEKAYGKFVIEPLEQGYGQTLGNSLRRVLLSSLPGAAINSMKIDGVKHQFSTIPGLKEDVVELALNLKKVRLTMEGYSKEGEEAELNLSKTGPGQVTAGDIEAPAGVTVVNPDLVLGTLSDKKSELSIKLTANKGYGYVTTEDKHADEIGVILLDALYSPVIRVNYRVEATSVGRMKKLERLVMEVGTDSTVSPMDAINASSKILESYFRQVYDPKIQGTEEKTVETPVLSEEILKMRIEELDIPTRIVNALANGGVETVGQLMDIDKPELMKIKNLGSKSLAVVEEKLQEKGVTLNLK